MSEPTSGMGAKAAWRLEMMIIGLGLLALVMIFQPFSINVFAIGSGLVVLAGLINNLLPLARASVSLRTVMKVALVIAMIFCLAVLVSIAAAHLYGVYFLQPPNPNTLAGKAALATPPFYLQPFVWWLSVVAALLASLVVAMNRSSRR